MVDEIVGICAICDKEVKKGKFSATKKDGLWLCGIGCASKYGSEKRKWTAEKWDELRQRQTKYEKQAQQPQLAESKLIEPITGKAKELLDETLLSEEILHILIKGTIGYLAATDRRIIVIKTGLAAGSLLERMSLQSIAKCNSLLYEQISGLQLNKGAIAGKISILALGSTESVDFALDQYGKFKLAIEKIEELRKTTQTKPAVAIPSIPDEIRKLAELKEAGILTSEEFETKKVELLKRL